MPRIAMIIGSLRAESINRKLGVAIQKRAAGKLDFIVPDVDLPLYNEDLWASPPAAVTALKQTVDSADGVLFVTPEYNRMTTPVIVNAIDWANRPYGQNSWQGKPAGVLGASPGAQGTAVAQSAVRHLMLITGMHVLGNPEVYITVKDDFFDADGAFASERTGAFVDKWIDAFAAWVARFG